MRRPILKPLSLAALFTAGAAAFALQANAQVLLSEGFNYTAGSNLGANAPWGGGSSATLQVGSGNLTYPGLNDLGGNSLTVTSGTASSDTNIFLSPAAAITSGSVYFSFLVDATTLPTANNYLISLNPSTIKPNGSSDTLAIYTGVSGVGWKIGVRTSGGASGTYESTMLTADTTYFIVGQYNFSTLTASLFLDPVPGGTQPVTASAAEAGTFVSGGIGDIGIKSQSATTQGAYILDNLIVGQSWTDVTPVAAPEPSTMALTAVGLVALAVRFRRSRN